MIANFKDFILESNSNMKMVDFLKTVERNYDSSNTFYTDISHYVVDKEERNWTDLRQNVQLQKTLKTEAEYFINFKLDTKDYKMYCNFYISYTGQDEKDAPEPGEEFSKRLSVVLENIDIRRLKIESQSLNYDSNPTGEVKRALEEFLIKMLSVDYDSLSSKIYKLEQK